MITDKLIIETDCSRYHCRLSGYQMNRKPVISLTDPSLALIAYSCGDLGLRIAALKEAAAAGNLQGLLIILAFLKQNAQKWDVAFCQRFGFKVRMVLSISMMSNSIWSRTSSISSWKSVSALSISSIKRTVLGLSASKCCGHLNIFLNFLIN